MNKNIVLIITIVLAVTQALISLADDNGYQSITILPTAQTTVYCPLANNTNKCVLDLKNYAGTPTEISLKSVATNFSYKGHRQEDEKGFYRLTTKNATPGTFTIKYTETGATAYKVTIK